MFTQLESLIVFSNSQSMADAATRLRISQSALSKRLSGLEHKVGYSLIEHHGRRAVLTERAQKLIAEVEPLLAEVTDRLTLVSEPEKVHLKIALADAIMVSWGAALLAKMKRAFPNIVFEVHSHRTAAVVERLSRGRYQIGLCTGIVAQSDGLLALPLVQEQMVVVCAEPYRDSFDAWQNGNLEALPVTCIEQKSAMWNFLAPHFSTWRLSPESTIESSVGAARLAVEGFSHALVPIGVAKIIAPESRTVKLEPNYVSFDVQESLNRPCSIVTRKTVMNHAPLRDVFAFIEETAPGLI